MTPQTPPAPASTPVPGAGDTTPAERLKTYMRLAIAARKAGDRDTAGIYAATAVRYAAVAVSRPTP